MAWPYRGIIVLLGLLSQTIYVKGCDVECKDDLIQRIDNLLDNKMDSKMDLIKANMETKLNSKIDLMKLEMENKFQNILESQHNLQKDQISNTITTTQAALTRDLQSVNTRVQKYEQNFQELKTLHLFIISQLTDHLAQDRATQNPSSSPCVNDLNDPINDLKTLTRESNVMLNDILENMEEMKVNKMEADNDTMNSMQMLTNEVETCPSGFFKMSSQCFKMFRDRERSWSEAKTKCEEEGYMLAQPDESVAFSLRKKLYEDFGDRSFAWLGAQGDGSKFVYAHGGLALDNASPLWWPDQPGSYVGADKCLFLLVDGSYFRDHPARPYFSNGCSASWYALCEVK